MQTQRKAANPNKSINNIYLPNSKSLSLPTTKIRKAYKISKWGWFGVVKSHSKSLEIAPFYIVHTFYCTYVPILHRFWDIARYWSKIADLNIPTSILRHVGVTPLERWRDLWHQKIKSLWSIVWRCLCYPSLTIFVKLWLVSDKRTHDDSIYRTNIASRGKNYDRTISLSMSTTYIHVCRASALTFTRIVFICLR